MSQANNTIPTPWFTGPSRRKAANDQRAKNAAPFRRINLLRVTRQEVRFIPVGVSVSILPMLIAVGLIALSVLTMGTAYEYLIGAFAYGLAIVFFMWTRPVTHAKNYGYLEVLFLFVAIILLLWVRTLDINIMHDDSLRGMVLFVATLGYVQIIFSTQVTRVLRDTYASLQSTDIIDTFLMALVPIGWYLQYLAPPIATVAVQSDQQVLLMSLWFVVVSLSIAPFTMWWLKTRNIGSVWIWAGSELMRAGLLIIGHEIIWHTASHWGAALIIAAPFIILFGDQMNRQIIEIRDNQQISSSTLTPSILIFFVWMFVWVFMPTNMPVSFYDTVWVATLVCIGAAFVRIFISNSVESRSYERVQELVSTDALTGVQNRRSLTLLLKNFEGRIMMTDMDGFKSINDLYGHDQGDMILVRFTDRLKAALPAARIFRLGGDEFAIVTEPSDVPFEQEAEVVVSCGLDTVYSETSVSVGGLHITEDMTQADILRNTDIALQAAKAKGKNQYVILGGSLLKERARDLQIHTNISNFGLGRLWLEYQPIYSIGRTQRIVAVEALARWTDPSFGDISPAEFVPILENQGMAVEFGEVIIKKALAQARTWVELGTPIMVFINLSERHLRDEQDVDALTQTLTRIGAMSRWIGIEVKESFFQNPAVVHNIWRLRATGVSIGIDDFGSGSSIFPVLRKLPVDVIKLDRSLLSALLAGESARHILKATLDMAVELDINVVVEGVEDEETARAVAQLGSTLGQGFYWSRPTLPNELHIPSQPLVLKRREIDSPLPSR